MPLYLSNSYGADGRGVVLLVRRHHRSAGVGTNLLLLAAPGNVWVVLGGMGCAVAAVLHPASDAKAYWPIRGQRNCARRHPDRWLPVPAPGRAMH